MQNPITLTKSILTAAARRNQFTLAEKKAKGKKINLHLQKRKRSTLLQNRKKAQGLERETRLLAMYSHYHQRKHKKPLLLQQLLFLLTHTL